MPHESQEAQLAKMARAHRMLIERVQVTDCKSSDAVIRIGAEVSAHTATTASLREQNRVLDPVVTEELRGDHRRLEEDLILLESLHEASPESADVEILASALLRRIQNLLEREQRMLYQPLLRLATNLEEQP